MISFIYLFAVCYKLLNFNLLGQQPIGVKCLELSEEALARLLGLGFRCDIM
jgi:hypothetical protein